MEKKTLAQELADNLNRNVVIEHLLETPGADLEKYLRLLPLDVLSQLDDTLDEMDAKKT